MHEIGICEDVLDAVLRRADGRTVTRVKVRIGAALHVSQDLFDQAFPLVAAGTEAADARVEVVTVPGEEMVLESIAVAAGAPTAANAAGAPTAPSAPAG
ncbi:MAG: hydrogenase/urease maturation nickel metallochaperone HypA [Frankiaceae bacterium]